MSSDLTLQKMAEKPKNNGVIYLSEEDFRRYIDIITPEKPIKDSLAEKLQEVYNDIYNLHYVFYRGIKVMRKQEGNQ